MGTFGLPRSVLATTLLVLAGAICATAAIAGRSPARTAVAGRLGFDAAPLGVPWPDDTTWGGWYSLHNGFGQTMVVGAGRGRQLQMSTRPPRGSDTYSSLVRSVRRFSDVDFTVRVRTIKQLRPSPNPWEVAWVLWRYTDNDHFYSFIVKPNGWELAKEDPAYPGKQRFLQYTYARAFPIGPTYEIRIRHIGDDVTVWVDGEQIVSFTDRERPYRWGSIALYTEDATTRYEPVTLRHLPTRRRPIVALPRRP